MAKRGSWVSEATSSLHVAVGTSPLEGDNPKAALAKDLALLKPALLYADSVTLLSPTATIYYKLKGMMNVDGRSRVKAMSTLLTLMPIDLRNELETQLSEYRRLQNKRIGKSRAEIIALHRLDKHFEDLWVNEFPPLIESQISMADGEAIIELIDNGRVSLEPVEDRSGSLSADVLVDSFVQKLDSLLQSPGSIPLFDDSTGDIVRFGVNAGRFNPSTLARNQMVEVASASGFMQKLPSFPGATVNEILDIRKELEPALIRFRSEMGTMSTGFSTEAYDQDFSREVDRQFRVRVAPALQELEEAVQSNSGLRPFWDAAIKDVKGYLTSGLVLVGMTQAGAIELPTALGALGTTAVSTGIVGAWAKHKANEEIKKHPFYLLHHAETKLGK